MSNDILRCYNTIEKYEAELSKQYNYRLLLGLSQCVKFLANNGSEIDVRYADNININRIRPLSRMGTGRKDLSFENRMRYFELLNESYFFSAQRDFESFLLGMDCFLEPEKRFYEPREKSLKGIVKDLQDLEDGKYELLSISCPPRIGKTRLSTYYVVWTAARHPEKSILCSGHASGITEKLYTDCLSLFNDPKYQYKKIFPDCPVSNSYARQSAIDLVAQKGYHTITTRSIGGSVTGIVEATNLLYCDDLISGGEESLSMDRLDKLWEIYMSDLESRRKADAGCKILHVATRWSTKDVIGRLQEQYEERKDAKFISIPALDENDESNFDYPYGLGFSTKTYQDKRSFFENDPVTWACVYQNEPYERSGLFFPPDSLKYYDGELPNEEPVRKLAFVDVAWGGGDSCSMPIAYEYENGNVYIPDVMFSKDNKTISKPMCVGKIISNELQWVEGEANNGGEEYMDDIAKMVKEKDYHCNITSKKAPAMTAKLTRISQYSPDIKNFYFLTSAKRSKEYQMFMKELTTTLQNGKSKHDDACDSASGLASMLYNKPKIATATVIDRRKLGF